MKGQAHQLEINNPNFWKIHNKDKQLLKKVKLKKYLKSIQIRILVYKKNIYNNCLV